MSEELQVKDLELKELFIKQELESLVEALNQVEDSDLVTMTNENWNIVKKYNDMGRKDLFIKHINFVAYTSFLTEYAGKRNLYKADEYKVLFALFEDIYQALQEQ